MLFTRPKCRLNNKIARLPLKKELKKWGKNMLL
jgi:hypothetical protein